MTQPSAGPWVWVWVLICPAIAPAIVPRMSSQPKLPPLLWLLTLGNLVIGSSAFIIGGIVALIAADLAVTPQAAGQAMTVYAMVTAFCSPLMVVLTGRWSRKRAVVIALGLIVVGNLMCALSTSLTQLLLGRALLGLGSMFTPLAAGLAVALVAPHQRGKALSLVFMGMGLSYVVGVPLGSWLALNHGWHSALWLMSGASVVVLMSLAMGLPANVQAPGAQLSSITTVLRNTDARNVLLTTLAYFTSIFTVFTYIGPVLTALVPMTGVRLTLTIALFGVAGVVGTLIGGAANDRYGARNTLLVMVPLLGLMQLALPFTAGHAGAQLVVLMLWGCAGFSLMAPQQSQLISYVGAQGPLALSLNSSMLYLGTAMGAAAGGLALRWIDFAHLSWVGAPFALLATWLVLTSRRASPMLAQASADTGANPSAAFDARPGAPQ